MENIMASGFRIRPKGSRLMKLSKTAENPHQVSMKSGKSYITVGRLFSDTKAGEVDSIRQDTLPAAFIDGMGLSPKEFMELRFCDVFDLVDRDGKVIIE